MKPRTKPEIYQPNHKNSARNLADQAGLTDYFDWQAMSPWPPSAALVALGSDFAGPLGRNLIVVPDSPVTALHAADLLALKPAMDIRVGGKSV
jgi:hypothetical protein